MTRSRPRRAAEDSPTPNTTTGGWRGFRRLLADCVLWTLGGLGLLSLLAAVAAHVWGFSIVLFSTGSMAPTIPAGSAALVRLLPAAEVEVGDVVTVQRPGLLPITHRITSTTPVDGLPGTREITMRGDANDSDDPAPYLISDARLVVASVPGVAQTISGLRDPRLMGLLTLVAGGLVTWAFWPRRSRKMTAVAAAAVVAGSSLLGATDAHAVETEHQVVGRHLVLTVVSDEEVMSAMVPNQPVLWNVGVNTRADEEGAVHIGLGLVADAVAADAITVDVLACPERWEGESCPGDAESWVAGGQLDQAFLPATNSDSGTREFGSTAAGTPVWVQVRATLDREDDDVKATLRIAAWGGGEVVSAESGGGKGDGSLAYTGSDGTLETLALAGAAIGTGLLVARFAGGRRRDADEEVGR